MRTVLVLWLVACGQSSGAPPGGGRGPTKFPVDVITVAPSRVEYVINAVGALDAFEKVQVTARVAGAVDRVVFSEGDLVKEGQTLAEIETQRYAVAVAAARAAFARTQAARADAELGFKRRDDTVEKNPGLISAEELETFRTRVRTAQADEAGAKAALDRAQLDLRDAYVRAPITGTIETRQVQTGQYMQAGAVLATLVRRDPLLLRFNVTEQDAQHLHTGMSARFHVRSDEKDYSAKISHVGGAADPQSRMVAVTALVGGVDSPGESGGGAGRAEGPRVLSPPDAPLRPGAFAEVAVPVGSRADAAVIPQQSVRPSEKGLLAFVVDGDVARERIVKLGMRTPDGKVEVLDGLKPGDLLVVRGAEALRDGAPVAVAGATTDAGTSGQSR